MKKELKKMLFFSTGCLCIASVTILFMPLAVNRMNQNKMWLSYVLAALFWVCTIAGYVCYALLCKKSTAAYGKKGRRLHENWWLSLPFATNLYGVIGNGLCILAVFVYIGSQLLWKGDDMWGYGSIFLFITGLHMSVICNSRCFIYTMNLKDRRVDKNEK